ncbi:MAG TPA: hypothetical protein VMD75_00620 [Candidatus Binataceae bacterium]|nr:hypothetical protein [Candidatus Binataceae bacterium]
MPQVKTGDAGLDRIIDAEWPYFVENCLDQTKTMGTVNGHIVQGVEFDLLGRRSARSM